MRHLWTVSYGFVGILHSSRLILLYSNHLEGRQTVENHLVHMGTRRTHVMTSSISIFKLCSFFRGFYFRGSRSVRENRENLHPAKISRYLVFTDSSAMDTFPATLLNRKTLTHTHTHTHYLTLRHSMMALLWCTWLYYIAPWLFPWLYQTLLHCSMALLSSTCLYYIVAWLYLALPVSTTMYHGSTWLYQTLLHCSMALLVSIWLYHIVPWLYLAQPDSTTLYHASTRL